MRIWKGIFTVSQAFTGQRAEGHAVHRSQRAEGYAMFRGQRAEGYLVGSVWVSI